MSGFLSLIIIMVLYAAPMIIAVRNDAKYKDTVGVLNVFLGWTFLGWVVALALSTIPKESKNG